MKIRRALAWAFLLIAAAVAGAGLGVAAEPQGEFRHVQRP